MADANRAAQESTPDGLRSRYRTPEVRGSSSGPSRRGHDGVGQT